MNKDEVQQQKATIKMKFVKEAMDVLQQINLLEDEKNMKHYDIILDYEKPEGELQTIFKVDITCDRKDFYGNLKKSKLFSINFKLYDENTGFAIFKSLRNHFLANNDLQYSAFQSEYNNQNNFSKHIVVTNHHVNLLSIIHSQKDTDKLQIFNNKINDCYDYFTRYVHLNSYTKDEKQEKKAILKTLLIKKIIKMFEDLNQLNYIKHNYDVVMNYEKAMDGDFYIFETKILKDRTSLPFNLGFKLKNEELGIELFNQILSEYKNNNTCLECFNMDDKPKYTLMSESLVNVILKSTKEEFGKFLDVSNNSKIYKKTVK